jgi:spermidine synthase
MEGLHLTADCFDCKADTEFFLCQEQLSKLLTKITIEAGLTIVGQKYHSFSNPDGSAAGVTGTLLLAESHVAIHTWPEKMP